jgi:hypothetical protein
VVEKEIASVSPVAVSCGRRLRGILVPACPRFVIWQSRGMRMTRILVAAELQKYQLKYQN